MATFLMQFVQKIRFLYWLIFKSPLSQLGALVQLFVQCALFAEGAAFRMTRQFFSRP
ncbi:hypothetical protein LAD77_02125 [Klebsiella pneumoniae]|nr:hypothetical protein [Klebsiella pneumoniae]